MQLRRTRQGIVGDNLSPRRLAKIYQGKSTPNENPNGAQESSTVHDKEEAKRTTSTMETIPQSV